MDGAYSAPHWSEASEGPCFSAITAGFATSRRRSRANLLSEAELAILARPVRSLFEGAIDESPRLDLVSRLCHPIDQRWCHGAGADGPSSEADRCDCSRLYLPALAGADPGRTNRLHSFLQPQRQAGRARPSHVWHVHEFHAKVVGSLRRRAHRRAWDSAKFRGHHPDLSTQTQT